MTTIVAIVFMLTSFTLSYSASRKGSSLMEGAARPAAQNTAPAPVAPPAPAAPAAPVQQAPAAPQTAK
jgi:preprotein translocase subunit SecG